ncbi:MAG TPA: hypothetical protein DIS90_11210 [Cytophagales bacterium]|nr:hypothetical protein [Cytophagales bacterium]
MNTTQQADPEKSKEAEPWMIFATSIVLILVGLGFGYYKFSNGQLARFLFEHGVKVTGTVVSESRSGKQAGETFYYELSYNWEDTPYVFKTSSKIDSYNVGDEVEVMLNPENPEEVLSPLDINKGSYMWSLIILTLGGFIFWLGLRKVKEKSSALPQG